MVDEYVRITSGDEIPATFGEMRRAVRKNTVAVREPDGVEKFEMPWGSLTAVPGTDLVIIQDSGEEYPIKREIFNETYREISPGRFRKTATSRLIQVPKGVLAVLATNEGELEVSHPDYIVVGAKNEVYANSLEWVVANLEFLNESKRRENGFDELPEN